MSIWTIADLHLSFGVPNKKMDVFGPRWHDHARRLRENWSRLIAPEDLVLIAGDISWAKLLEEVRPDLDWIHALPGTKVMIQGNHDYWWSSLKKVRSILPSSIHVIQNDAFHWKDISIAGTRLWDTPEYTFDSVIESTETPEGIARLVDHPSTDDEKVFNRELQRLELSLQALNQQARLRVVMTHYPPIGPDLAPSRTSALLEKYNVNLCLFGHIHSVIPNALPMGEKNGIRYLLTACDYLNCVPLKIEN